MLRFVSVAVPVPQLDLLTYRVPDPMDVPAAGTRVLVPVGARTLVGCVVAAGDDARVALGSDVSGVRDLVACLDAEPYLPGDCLALALWTSQYYACSPGDAIAAAFPPKALVEDRRRVRLTTQGRAALDMCGVDGLDAIQRDVLRALADGGSATLRTVGARLACTGHYSESVSVAPIIASLERIGLLDGTVAGAQRASGQKRERVITLTDEGRRAAMPGNETATASRLGARQRELLRALLDEAKGRSARELRERGLAVDSLARLEARGFVRIGTRTVDRNPFLGPWGKDLGRGGEVADLKLTREQARALASLDALRARREFGVALLHGITGSGKTEIYLRLAAQAVRDGQSTIVLVPEIGLTPAVAEMFRARFGNRVALLHSGLSDGERHDQWHHIRQSQVDVVVGTRSAVFAPLANVGLIVIDEEHDASYKQDESPRYNGRDVAIVRAQRGGSLVVLGSATPSMESYSHALAGRYTLVELEGRVFDRPLAEVRTVDMRREYAKTGPDTIVSGVLAEAIGQRLDRREQVLLLLNRRGLSRAVLCRQCGASVECPNCSVSLVVSGRGVASCHYCNHTRPVPRTCPACGAPYLELMGFGTERVEQDVTDIFPQARVARLDRDSTRRRGSLPEILGDFRRGRIDVLVGTQMIAKGHDFPNVTLVGVISADVGLGIADFRASERTFQLLTQVVGRAGRGERPGEAIIQTIYPNHFSIRHATRQDYRGFFADEIVYRKAMRYPPAVALVNGIVRGPSLSEAMAAGADLVGRIRRLAPRPGAFVVLGPAVAPLARLKSEHRVQFFMKGLPAARVAMRDAVMGALDERPELRRRVVIDIDPMTVL